MGSSSSMSGKGPKSSGAREEVGSMNPGKVGKARAKAYFEGGDNSYSPKGMSKRNPRDE